MNIWIFNHYAIGPGASGGTRHYDLAKQLVQQGHQVTIFASSFNHQLRKEGHIFDPKLKYKEDHYDGVRFVWIKTMEYNKNDWRRVLNMLDYTFRVYTKSLKEKENPDVIVGSLMHPFAAFVGYIVAKKKKCKFYFEERDLWPQTLIDLGKVSKSNPIVWLLSKLELFLYKKADRIIVLFDKAVDYVKQRGIESEKVLYIPNGVDLERYDERPKSLPTEMQNIFDKLQGKFIAIYTGAHGLANHLDVLLDSAKLLDARNQNIHFIFVGDGPLKGQLIERKEREGLSNITFLPSVPKELIPLLLYNSDVGIIAMKDAEVYKWGISLNKLFDYMGSALPIAMLSNIGNTPIEKSGGGINVSTPLELAESIEKLYFDSELAKEYGMKARLYVEKNHSWPILANKLIHVLKEDFPKK